MIYTAFCCSVQVHITAMSFDEKKVTKLEIAAKIEKHGVHIMGHPNGPCKSFRSLSTWLDGCQRNFSAFSRFKSSFNFNHIENVIIYYIIMCARQITLLSVCCTHTSCMNDVAGVSASINSNWRRRRWCVRQREKNKSRKI